MQMLQKVRNIVTDYCAHVSSVFTGGSAGAVRSTSGLGAQIKDAPAAPAAEHQRRILFSLCVFIYFQFSVAPRVGQRCEPSRVAQR